MVDGDGIPLPHLRHKLGGDKVNDSMLGANEVNSLKNWPDSSGLTTGDKVYRTLLAQRQRCLEEYWPLGRPNQFHNLQLASCQAL